MLMRDLVRSSLRPVITPLKQLVRRLDVRTLTEDSLCSHLSDLGVVDGAVVVLHSSMDHIARRVAGMTATRLIDLLCDLLGSSGTLLMPTYSFRGSQEDHVKTCRKFNPKRSPSCVGLLTEVFRRRADVIRSLHPTHSVAAWGRHARNLTKDHHLDIAFGRKSPLCRMAEYDGIAIGLGCYPVHFVPFHVPEALHPVTRNYHYSKTGYEMTIQAESGDLEYTVYPLRRDRPRTPLYREVAKELKAEGLLRFVHRKGLPLGTIAVKPFIKRALELIEENRYSVPVPKDA